MELKKIIYAIACLSFAVVIGAAIYEHVAVVPRWAAAPPVSLTMFQGSYGLNPAPFWIAIHPVTLLLFIGTIVLFWKSGSRKYLLISLVGYVIVLVITFAFFVPELIQITGTSPATEIDYNLKNRAETWEMLSLIRLGFLIILAIVCLLGLTKTGVKSI